MPSRPGGDVSFGLSFVIPTVGRVESLKSILQQISEVVTWPFQVVVVYDGDDPAVESEVGEAMTVIPRGSRTVVPLGRHVGVAQARNSGVAESIFPFCVFLDDDVVLTDLWWDALRAAVAGGVRCGTGPILTKETSVLARARDQRYSTRYASLETGDSVNFLAGGNSFVAKELWMAAGGFPDVKVGSDSLLIERIAELGEGCIFSPQMGVYHQHDRGAGIAIANAFHSGRTTTSATLMRAETRRTLRAALGEPDPSIAALNLGLMLIKWVGYAGSMGRASS